MEPTPSEREIFPDIPDGTITSEQLFDIDEEVTEIQPKKLGFLKTCLKYFRLFLQALFSYVGLTAILVGYLFLGAIVFSAIEAPAERRIRQEIRDRKESFFRDFYDTINKTSRDNWTNLALVQLSEIERDSKSHYYIFDEENGAQTLKWTFFGSMLFSLTVVSTIGYGHIAPVTPVGQVFCIVYALVGLPLMLLVLTNVGRVMANVARIFYIVYTSRLCKRLRKSCKSNSKNKNKRRKKKLKKKKYKKGRLKDGQRHNKSRGNAAPKKLNRNSRISKTPSQSTIRVDAGPYREGRPMSVNTELMQTEHPFPPSYSETRDLGSKLGDSISDRVSNRDRLSDRISRSSKSSRLSSDKPSSKRSSPRGSTEKVARSPRGSIEKVSPRGSIEKVSPRGSIEKVSPRGSIEKVPDKSTDKPVDCVKINIPDDESDKVFEEALDNVPNDTTVLSENDKLAEKEMEGMFTEDAPKENLDASSPVPTTPPMFKAPRFFDEEDYNNVGDYLSTDDDDDDFMMANDDIPPDYAPPPPPPGEIPYEYSDVDMLDITSYERDEPDTAQVTATSESDRDTDADVTTPLVRHVSLRESRSSDRIRKPILRTGSSLELGEQNRRLSRRQRSCIEFREFDEQSLAPPIVKDVVIKEEPSEVYRLTIPEEDAVTNRSEAEYSFSGSACEGGGYQRRRYRKGKPRKRRVTREERKAAAKAIKERKKITKVKAKTDAKERVYAIRQRRLDERKRKPGPKINGKRTFLVRRPILAPPSLRAFHHSRQLKFLDSSTAVRLATHNKPLGNSREDITNSIKGLRTEKLDLNVEYDKGKVRTSPTLRRRISTRSTRSSRLSIRSRYSERSKFSERSKHSDYSGRSGYSDRSKVSSVNSGSSSSRSGGRKRRRRKGKGSLSPSSSRGPSCSEEPESEPESSEEEQQQREITTADIPILPVLAFFFGYIGAGAILFAWLMYPNWTLFESFYFCFITLTTIGFGDYVPDNSMESLIACCLYTMIGMAVTSMCIALMMKKFVVTIQKIGKRVGIIEKTEPEGPS